MTKAKTSPSPAKSSPAPVKSPAKAGLGKAAPEPAKQAPPQKRIFLVDDHPLFREGLATMIGREPDLVVCGQAENAGQALDGVNQTQPDLVLLDLSLPGRGGLEVIKDLRAVHPTLLVLVVSMHDESLFAERVLRAGALGYIMKQEGPEKMIEAIRRTLKGEVYVSQRTAGDILGGFGRNRRGPGNVRDLSDRELEVFQLIGRGLDTHAIASQLNLSPKTVDAHRGNIKAKLDVRSSTELICRAARWVAAETKSPTDGV